MSGIKVLTRVKARDAHPYVHRTTKGFAVTETYDDYRPTSEVGGLKDKGLVPCKRCKYCNSVTYYDYESDVRDFYEWFMCNCQTANTVAELEQQVSDHESKARRIRESVEVIKKKVDPDLEHARKVMEVKHRIMIDGISVKELLDG